MWTALSRRKESTSWQTGSRWLLSHLLFFNVVCVAGRLVFFQTPKSLFLDRASFFILVKQPRSRKRLSSFFWPHALVKDISGSKKRAARCRRLHKPHALRCTSNSVRLWSFKAALQEIWPCVEAPRLSKTSKSVICAEGATSGGRVFENESCESGAVPRTIPVVCCDKKTHREKPPCS